MTGVSTYEVGYGGFGTLQVYHHTCFPAARARAACAGSYEETLGVNHEMSASFEPSIPYFESNDVVAIGISGNIRFSSAAASATLSKFPGWTSSAP